MNSKLIFVCLCTMLLISCGGESAKDASLTETTSPENIQDTGKVTVNDTTKFKFDFTLANIPSPATSIQELDALNVPYDAAILNDTRNAVKYSTEFQKALNLGVYNIDMAYAMMNDKGQDVLLYMKSVMMLAENLGLKNAVSGMVGKRAEANLNKRDSLFKILDEIFSKSDSYLRTNERLYTAATVFAGSWMESLYLNCKISERATDQGAVEKGRRILWEQRFHLGNLTKVLQDYRDKKENQELLNDLNSILDDLMTIKRSEDLGSDKFKSISAKIYTLRNKHTS